MTDSPLEQVSPTSLEDLFNQDPTIWSGPSDDRVKFIVQKLREDRARWNVEERVKKAAKGSPKKAADLNLKLDDLDLDV